MDTIDHPSPPLSRYLSVAAMYTQEARLGETMGDIADNAAKLNSFLDYPGLFTNLFLLIFYFFLNSILVAIIYLAYREVSHDMGREEEEGSEIGRLLDQTNTLPDEEKYAFCLIDLCLRATNVS